MEFYEMLTQVITLPQYESRIAHPALKRQCNLDDNYISFVGEMGR
jgi:hypothetical protein